MDKAAVCTSKYGPPLIRYSWSVSAYLIVFPVTWLQVVGILSLSAQLLRVPDSVMGLTLMAWGNSLGDLAGNTSLALSGLPSMALTACIASECMIE